MYFSVFNFLLNISYQTVFSSVVILLVPLSLDAQNPDLETKANISENCKPIH